MILYVVLLLVLASFVFMFLGARTWNWGYVILVEAMFLATVGFFILAAETVRINGVLRGQMRTAQKQLDDVTAQNEALRDGTSNTSVLNGLRNTDPPTLMPEEAESIASLDNLDHELLIATRQRGRVWRNVAPAGFNPQSQELKVNIASPAPANLPKDTVVYIFEDEVRPVAPPAPTEEGAAPAPAPPPAPTRPGNRPLQYLGSFNVTQSAGQAATLQPSRPLDPQQDFELARLVQSRGPWVIYENMPTDRYEIFAGMNDDQLKQRLPKQSVNEYLRHGKEATADDDPARKVGLDEEGKPLPADQIGKATKVVYQRRLRDYATEFDELSRRLVAMRTDKSAIQRDEEQLAAAKATGEKLQAFRTAEKEKLTKDFAGVTKERQAIEKHLAQLNQLIAKARQLTNEAMARNRQLSDQLTARQVRDTPANGSTSQPKPAGPLALNATK
jgi:hypothetical protein